MGELIQRLATLKGKARSRYLTLVIKQVKKCGLDGDLIASTPEHAVDYTRWRLRTPEAGVSLRGAYERSFVGRLDALINLREQQGCDQEKVLPDVSLVKRPRGRPRKTT